MVLDFHGYSEGASIHRQMSALGAYGDEQGFVTVTPQGLGAVARWDTTLGSPDLEFVGALMDTVEADLCIDTNRVYATGLSNGAFLTSAVACQYSDRIAAVAPVAGVRTIEGCEFARPVPIVAFHGTADGYVDYEGGLGEDALDLPAPDGSGRTIGDSVTSEQIEDSVDSANRVPEIMAAWAERNGCGAQQADRPVTDDVTELRWDCPPDATTQLYRVTDGGHTWPGSTFSQSIESIVGRTTMSVVADEVMWRFFVDHPLTPAD
jgi:polyhydroxybutyrate depolymerase